MHSLYVREKKLTEKSKESRHENLICQNVVQSQEVFICPSFSGFLLIVTSKKVKDKDKSKQYFYIILICTTDRFQDQLLSRQEIELRCRH